MDDPEAQLSKKIIPLISDTTQNALEIWPEF